MINTPFFQKLSIAVQWQNNHEHSTETPTNQTWSTQERMLQDMADQTVCLHADVTVLISYIPYKSNQYDRRRKKLPEMTSFHSDLRIHINCTPINFHRSSSPFLIKTDMRYDRFTLFTMPNGLCQWNWFAIQTQRNFFFLSLFLNNFLKFFNENY